jgi:hypothetical protein
MTTFVPNRSSLFRRIRETAGSCHGMSRRISLEVHAFRSCICMDAGSLFCRLKPTRGAQPASDICLFIHQRISLFQPFTGVFSSWFRTRTSMSCAVRGICQFTSLIANVFRQSGASLWVRPCCLFSVEQIWRTWQAVVGFRGFSKFVCVIIKHSHNKWFCLNVERKRSTILLFSSSPVWYIFVSISLGCP